VGKSENRWLRNVSVLRNRPDPDVRFRTDLLHGILPPVLRTTDRKPQPRLDFSARFEFTTVEEYFDLTTTHGERTTLALCVLWAAAPGAMLYLWPSPPPYLVWSSVLYVLYYAVLSLYLTLKTQKTSAH